jgi:hypothetical protein
MSTFSDPSELEQRTIQLCGLSKLLAPGLLRRALADVQAGSPPTPDDVLRARSPGAYGCPSGRRSSTSRP